jgi:hypothetical protein
MIRPFTFLCFLLACASGLYLYQSKHKVQLLDYQIEQTVHQTEAAREQVRLLNAEWMLLNDPDRLRQLASQFLTLRTVAPGQFTTMAELASRLPPVQIPETPAAPAPAETPMADAQPPAAPAATAPGQTTIGQPAIGQPPSGQTPSGQPASAQIATVASPAPAPMAPHPAPAPSAERRAEPAQVAEHRPAPPIARPAAPPVQVAQRSPVFVPEAPRARPRAQLATPVSEVMPVQGGSALGMAQHGSLPPPRPIALFQPADGH